MRLKLSLKLMTLSGVLAFSSVSYAAEFVDEIADATYEEYEKAVALMVDTDQNGDPKSQFELAQAFHNGAKGYVDIEQAHLLYNLAAENGYRPAQRYLSVAYREGSFGFEKNGQLSRYWESLYENGTSVY